MAGDWIKMRSNLWDDPRITGLVDATDATEAAIVGGLYWLWATADQHSEDGVMPGLTLKAIDRKTGIKGLGDALVAIGWLADHPDGVRIIRFDEHNGASAKRRCTEAQRKANSRTLSASDADISQTDAEETRTDCVARGREEKEEDIKPLLKTKTEPRGTRLAPDWVADAAHIEFCKATRPDLDPQVMQDKFRDYWTGVAGKGGVKLNWLGTWKNFIRSERSPPARASPSNKPSRHSGFDQIDYSEGVGADGRIQ